MNFELFVGFPLFSGGLVTLTGYNQCYFKRARRAASVLRLIPTVLLIGVSGSISRNEAQKSSDIDFFVVSKKGRIFTTRFFCKFLMLVLGIARKNGDRDSAGKICLNYFLTEEALDFRPHNSGTIRHHRRSIILYTKEDMLGKLIKSNRWLKPRFQTELCHPKLDLGSRQAEHNKQDRFRIKYGMTKYGALLFNTLEKLLKDYQIRKIRRDPLTSSYPNKIIFQDQELRFHPPKG